MKKPERMMSAAVSGMTSRRPAEGFASKAAHAKYEGTVDEDWTNNLFCPRCGIRLRADSQEVHCGTCNQSWPVVDGIPHFVAEFPYWGEITQDRMREVNRLAETGDWKRALLDFPDPSVVSASDMILNLERANWQWLVNLPSESRVLDLGAGTGTNSHALAMHYREVFALEPVLERVDFMRHRFTQEELVNTRIVRSSLWLLPFEAQSFDLVVMNGVLEWVAEGREGDPGEIQEAALRNAYRLLRPGGYLYVGIENRLCAGYFMGYRDPHCGLPFVTVLPRRLAQWYARRKGTDGYRNYLYSSRGYRNLMKKAGFSDVEIYVALPSYNHPRFLIPLNHRMFSYYTRNFNRASGRLRKALQTLLLNLRVLQECEYSFVILARK